MGADNAPLGLLGAANVLDSDVDAEADIVEIRATLDTGEAESSDRTTRETTSSETSSSKTTSSESTYTWKFENGRRYASSELGHYYMPNDAPEIQRLNEQHRVMTDVKHGVLHFAPLPDKTGLKILDVGCGSGIWCIEMAEQYPEARIFGMDVSPIQPAKKPQNVEWTTHDMEHEWPYPESYFDLIRVSLVHGCVADWETLLSKIKRHLAPGGYLEHQELAVCTMYLFDEHEKKTKMPDKLDQLPPLYRWSRLMEQAGRRRGREMNLAPHLVSMQASAGFENVTEQVLSHKWGGWPSDARERALGTRSMVQIQSGMDGFSTVMFTTALGWSLADTQRFLADVKRDITDDKLRKGLDLHVVYGQKPLGRRETAHAQQPNNGGSSRPTALVDAPGLQLGAVVVAAIGASFAAAFAHWLLAQKAR